MQDDLSEYEIARVVDLPEETKEPASPYDALLPVTALPRRRREVPWATLTILFVTLLVAVAQLATNGFRFSSETLGSDVGDWVLGAKIPSLIAHGEWWRLVTANFLHGSPMHLFANMIGLLLLGMLIEGVYGRA